MRDVWCINLGIKGEGKRVSDCSLGPSRFNLCFTIALLVAEGKGKAAKMNEPQSELLAKWARSSACLRRPYAKGEPPLLCESSGGFYDARRDAVAGSICESKECSAFAEAARPPDNLTDDECRA